MSRAYIIALGISTLITWSMLGYMMYNRITRSEQVWPVIPEFNDDLLAKIPGYVIMSCYIIMSLLAPFQFLPVPPWFRIIYLLIVMLVVASGLLYMNFNDTAGGSLMTVPFTVYATLLFVYATIAINRSHLWMIRVYILAAASIIYQLLYLVPFLMHEQFTFHAPMDAAFNWVFFIIPLSIGELALFIYYYQPFFYCRLKNRDYATVSDNEEQFFSSGIIGLPRDGRLVNPNYLV